MLALHRLAAYRVRKESDHEAAVALAAGRPLRLFHRNVAQLAEAELGQALRDPLYRVEAADWVVVSFAECLALVGNRRSPGLQCFALGVDARGAVALIDLAGQGRHEPRFPKVAKNNELPPEWSPRWLRNWGVRHGFVVGGMLSYYQWLIQAARLAQSAAEQIDLRGLQEQIIRSLPVDRSAIGQGGREPR